VTSGTCDRPFDEAAIRKRLFCRQMGLRAKAGKQLIVDQHMVAGSCRWQSSPPRWRRSATQSGGRMRYRVVERLDVRETAIRPQCEWTGASETGASETGASETGASETGASETGAELALSAMPMPAAMVMLRKSGYQSLLDSGGWRRRSWFRQRLARFPAFS
jgi:hypothetical protein